MGGKNKMQDIPMGSQVSTQSPINGEVQKLFIKVEHLEKQLRRVSNLATESSPKTPKEDTLLCDLQELNDRIGLILDRLQI